MPDVTDCLRLPYPLLTDEQDVPADMAALAEKLDDLLCGQLSDIDELKTAVNNRVKKAGDSMTGTLFAGAGGAGISVHRSGNAPFIEFTAHPGPLPRYGYVQGLPALMSYSSDDAAGAHRWIIGTTEQMRLSAGGILDVNQVRTDVRLTAGAPNGNQLLLIDTAAVALAPTVYQSFYSTGTVASPGTHIGWFGFSSNTTFRMQNLIAGGDIILATTGNDGDITITPGAASQLNLGANSATKAIISGDQFLFGKAAADAGVAGVEIFCGGGNEGLVRSTVTTHPNFQAYHEGGANADDQYFYSCYNAASVLQGGIRSVGTTGVEISSVSDRRLKTDLGLVESALDRVMAVPVHRFTWNADDGLGEQEGFFADEVQASVPNAVSGAPDAVTETGEIDPQTMAPEALIPVLWAAVQELRAEVALIREACCG